jgi:predicted AlkP superfamily phosphohydrolase/phosphomutase
VATHLAMCLVATLGLLACEAPPRKPPGRVLLIGIDGATLRIIQPLLDAGRLPTLGAIAQHGVHGPLRSFLPLESPPIWASIATAKTREKHGILSFVRGDEDGASRLYDSTDRKVHALWNIASRAGLTVGVVNWWNTYPVETVAGIMISDHALPGQVERRSKFFGGVAKQAGPTVFPPEWESNVTAIVEDEQTLTPFANPFVDNEALAPWTNPTGMSYAFTRDTLVTRIALAVEAAIRPDLLMVFLPGIDRVSHTLWANVESEELYPPRLRPTPPQRAAGLAALHLYYEYTDALIGLLLERFSPEDLVLIVSDHGFEAGVTMMTTTGRHKTDAARDGVIFARGTDVPSNAPAGTVTVNDVTPTVLAWLGLPVANDMDGAPASFLDVGPPTRVASHDTGPIERLETGGSGADEKIKAELRALGYIE